LLPNEILTVVAFTGAICVSTLLWTLYEVKRHPKNPRAYLGSVFEFAPDAILLVASDGNILLANKQTHEMFGYEENELIGRSVDSLIPERLRGRHDSYRAGYVSSPRIRPMGSGLALYGRRKDGSEFPVDIMLSPIEEGRCPTVIAIVRDITVRIRVESERLDAINMVARNLAHDLRNPLTAIASASYVLDAEAGISEQGKRMLKIIAKNVSAAEGIVSNLLAISSTAKPQMATLQIDQLLKDVLGQMVISPNVTVIHEGEKGLRTMSDPSLLKRALTNLCVNALDSMPNGGTFTISTNSENGHVVVAISDTGLGMSKETISRLGTLFFTTKAKGMGIGFAISKKFIEGTGGTLEVSSQEGLGTTVSVSLPRAAELPEQTTPI